VYLTILGSQIPKEVPASITSAIADQGLPASTISALIADLMAGDTGEPSPRSVDLEICICPETLSYGDARRSR
jgi:hypothetical protein